MSSLSYLLAGQGMRSTEGFYVAHGDGNRYEFSVAWRAEARFVRWTAAISLRGASIAWPGGRIDSHVVGVDDSEKWVRAAVELAIERMAAASARAASA